MMPHVTYLTALFYGVLSFFTPCILPMLPVYFGYLAGDGLKLHENQVTTKVIHAKLMLNAFGFVLGVSLLNVLLGFGFRAVAGSLNLYSHYLRYIGGGVMIVLGIFFIFDLKIPFLQRSRRIEMKHFTPNFLKSFLLGVTFSFGWTPCNGPIIASILIIASFQQDYMRAGTLMLTYSLGFAVMFLLSALLVGLFVGKAKKLYPYFGVFRKVAGGIMILMGVLLIMDKLAYLTF